jgi:hypothetical protein
VSPGELDARKPVWLAFSELFLDTDVRMSYVYAAELLARSPYSLDELKRILDEEVAPALEFNLNDVAGEWAGFDERWLVAHIERTLASNSRASIRLDSHWRILESLVTMVRSRPATLPVLRSLMPLFLYKQPSISPVRDHPRAAVEHVFRDDLTPLLQKSCIDLHRGDPDVYPSPVEIEKNWLKYAAEV